MSPRILFVCGLVLLMQEVAGQCSNSVPLLAAPCASVPLIATPCTGTLGANPAALAASNGPGLTVTSASPLIPTGVSVLSENVYDGALAVGGAIPFLGTVALEGALPTVGAGGIEYGCGNGAVVITAEDIGAIGIVGPLGAVGPLGIPGPLNIAGPVGIDGLLGIPGILGTRTGCNWEFI